MKAVVGGGHLEGGGTQTYFTEFPDGSMRFLPFDFIRKENVWFAETRNARGWLPLNRQLSITDLGEWPPTRILGTELSFQNCQECHGSQIQVTYDLEKKRYVTRYKSLAINCESCHGPGKRHVELAKSGTIDEARDIGMKPLETLSKDESLAVCFQCHALKDEINSGYLPGRELENYYALKFPIFGQNPYHVDGRIRAFGYQQNHLFSDCYLNGSMTCVDCHDPHSQSYRDVEGNPLIGKFDNGQCTGCHASKANAQKPHSHHKLNSSGSLCTSCHMPFLQHKSVGARLRFARSDHTIPIPRPEFDTKLGIENACKKCHPDKNVSWLQAKTEEWYGQLKPHKRIITNLLAAQKVLNRKDAGNLMLDYEENHPMAQIAGLSMFIQEYLSPEMPYLEPEIIARLKGLAESENMDLKALALMSLHFCCDKNPDIHGYLLEELQSLESEENNIRERWALALAYLGGVYREKAEYDKAIASYEKATEIIPDDAATLVNLGIVYDRNGETDKAIGCYQKAAALQPGNPLAWVNLGIAFQKKGDPNSELSAYLNAIKFNPWSALVHFDLGSYYYKRKDFANAIAFYKKAVEIDPSLALGHFYLGRAFVKSRDLENAVLALKAGLQYQPDEQGARQLLRDIEKYLSRR
ncbi:MAG: tetratricopeptide repeat protein [bacterium]